MPPACRTTIDRPSFEELERLARTHATEWTDRRDLVGHPAAIELVEDRVAAVNGPLARFEQIQKTLVHPVSFTIEGGHLTPTLEVRGRIIQRQFADHIDRRNAE